MIRQHKRQYRRRHWRFAYTHRREKILRALSLDKRRQAAERAALICRIARAQIGLEAWC